MSDDVQVALNQFGVAKIEPHLDANFRASVMGSQISVPYRTYFPAPKPSDITELSRVQRAIFASVMTRHHDGYQRETWVRELCAHPTQWTVPFVVFSLGDYVIEVLQAITENLTPEWIDLCRAFRETNDFSLLPLNHRIITYWHIYYRYYPPNHRKLATYPGYIAANQLGLWDRHAAPKLTKTKWG